MASNFLIFLIGILVFTCHINMTELNMEEEVIPINTDNGIYIDHLPPQE